MTSQLKGLGFHIVVVDDGSGSNFAHIFKACNKYADLLTHTENQGKGQALKTGLSHIYKNFSDNSVIVTVDADGQHKIEDACAVCKIAEENRTALVLGSRKLKGKIPLRSRIGNAATRFVFKVSTSVGIHDTQTGLRAFSYNLIQKMLTVAGVRYEYEMNVLLQFAKDKTPIIEHEIETIYLNDNASSHFHAIKDSLRIYKEIIKFSASSLIGFLVDYTMYSLLLLLGFGLVTSNVIARVISASVNFTLNRKLVFKSQESLMRSIAKYLILAIAILIGNTLVLGLLVNIFNINQMLAKIITEILFFALSWLMQRLIVFRKRGAR